MGHPAVPVQVLAAYGHFAVIYRRSPVGLAFRRPTGEQVVVRTGPGLVTIEGEPGEILLHGSGRRAVRVELRGRPADVEALQATPRGF
jgi:hypothetical protein